MFKSQGYSANVYHENDGSFYNREQSELSFGYEKYNSFRDMTDEDILYEDDLFMADCDDLYNQIVGEDGFMNYYITYSAHPPYKTSDERFQAALERHPELADKEINSETDIYEVYASLTDDMVGRLMERMEEDGSLDNTVILFVADHANLSDLEDTSDTNYFNAQNIPCFIYSKDIEPQTVEKICTNIDLLPTVINMFGIENPGTYIGNDIFDSESEGIAYLPSFDWKTEKCLYINGSVAENYTDEEISDEYIDEINQRVEKQTDVNNLVLYTEYFKTKKNE
jgi:phosphoglycerol transferase MdoB-like AlkP superfamily enzyme